MAPRHNNLQSTSRSEGEKSGLPLNSKGFASRLRNLFEKPAGQEKPVTLQPLLRAPHAEAQLAGEDVRTLDSCRDRAIADFVEADATARDPAIVGNGREDTTAAAAAFRRVALESLRAEAGAKLLEAHAALREAERAVRVAEEAGHELGDLADTLAGLEARAEQVKQVKIKKTVRSREEAGSSNRARTMR